MGRHRRDSEVDAVLAEIIDIAEDYAPDLIVHSGDLFDSPGRAWTTCAARPSHCAASARSRPWSSSPATTTPLTS
ncbi:hypothetical protein [Streptomyces sp. WAC00288]|uniref:hypothetical protein n=1 Tax=Streptomyces sp. WAC00288 TaxID=2094021 RepID=UPI001F2580D8|nr:hypothetical protein [Streptomyces sp. WAC00288]